MKKILISIKKNYIAFSYKNNTTNNLEKIINTNVISDNELLFSEDYIRKNTKIVSIFLKELCTQYDKHIIAFQKNDMFELLFGLFNKNNQIKALYLFEEASLPFTICEGLIKNNYIKQLNCYNVPTFMIEMLDKYGVEVTSRNEMLFTSNFMEENNLVQFSKIFYKISIKLTLPLSEKDLEDFESFCKINKYLRTINIENINIEDIDKILDILKKARKSRIRIMIHDNVNDEEVINTLKKLNKKSKRSKIIFKLVYSEDYLMTNMMNQTLVSILKICGGIIACLIITVFGYILYTNNADKNNDIKIKNEIGNIIKNDDDDDDENTDLDANNLKNLLKVNNDTVGWLKVNNTNIDYPVVQTIDNDYYLDKNFYKEGDKAGWIFMDFRNDPQNLNKNTIIYGHNRYSNGVMFGTLQKSLNKSWYTNEENKYITFNTLYDNYTWEIFSIYKIDVTNDYIQTTFKDNKEWLSFVKMIKKRSIYDFNTTINPEDKIITLSTCMGINNQQRLVVHAVYKKK